MTTQQQPTTPLRVSLATLRKHGAPPPREPCGLVGEHVRLRPITPEDYPMIYRAETSGPHAWRGRFRGQTMSPQQHATTLTSPDQFIVQTVDGRDVGFVIAYAISQPDRHLTVGCWRLDDAKQEKVEYSGTDGSQEIIVPASAMMQGIVLFLQHLFESYALARIYFEVPEYNLDQIGGGMAEFCTRVGHKPDHKFLDNRWWFEDTYELTREAFMVDWIQDAIRRGTDIGKAREVASR